VATHSVFTARSSTHDAMARTHARTHTTHRDYGSVVEEARTGPAHDPLRMHGHQRGGRVRLRSPLAPPANVRLFCLCLHPALLLLLLLRFIEVVPDCETTASIQKVCFHHRARRATAQHSLTLTGLSMAHRKLAVRRRCSRTRCSPTGSRNTTHKVLPPSRVPSTSPVPLTALHAQRTSGRAWRTTSSDRAPAIAVQPDFYYLILILLFCNYLLILFR
jgi:hypothetical protein